MQEHTLSVTDPFPINNPTDEPALIASFQHKFPEICIGLFSSNGDWKKISEWQRDLDEIKKNPRYYKLLSLALINSEEAAVVFFASATLTSQVIHFGNVIPAEYLFELGKCLFQIILGKLKPASSTDKCSKSLYQLSSILLKHTWFEQKFSLKPFLDSLLAQVNSTLKLSDSLLIPFAFMQSICDEMQSTDTRVSAIFRRVFYQFECKYLGKIFQTCISSLELQIEQTENLLLLKPILRTLHSCFKI